MIAEVEGFRESIRADVRTPLSGTMEKNPPVNGGDGFNPWYRKIPRAMNMRPHHSY